MSRADGRRRGRGAGAAQAGGQELSTHPARCQLAIERRTIPGEPTAAVAAEFATIAQAIAASGCPADVAVTTTLGCDPLAIDPAHSFAALVRVQAAATTDREPAVAGAGGWRDSAVLTAAGISTVVVGPDGAGVHGDVERVALDSLDATRRVLLAVADAWCA